ncbi:MAG: leucine-rich repeat domain-containing protein, partial [Muribaculaceae bacterium]|nr:leucine-rich repeat domain-containing protein [Muribaculaceae bacterium]
SVGEYAFYNTSLTSLTMPASVKSMGNGCFQHNPNLKDVILKGDAAIPMNAFQNCQELETVTIAGNVPSVGNYAFNFCPKLKNLVLPSSVTSIGDHVFQMSGLVNISLPPHASLGQSLFWSCADLEEITFPENLYTIPAGLFYGCSSLTTIVCPAALPPVMGEGYSRDPFEMVDKTKITVKVPDYSLVNYKLDSEWVKFGRIEGTASYSSIVLNSEFSFSNNRRPQSAVDVSLDWGGKLSIGGNVPFNMKSFRMAYMPYVRNEQPNTNYGQLINSSPAVTANDGTLSLYIERDRWYFFSFPVDVKLRDLSHSESANFVVREYDGGERAANGVGNSWKDLTSDASLLAGKGYLIRTNGNGWINVVLGAEACAKLLDNSDRLLSPVTYESEDAANAGWNLLANPWPSYYDLAFSDLNTPVLLWDTATGQYNAYSVLDDKVVLQPGQAFFIQHAEEGNVKLPGAGRCFSEEGVVTVERSETRGTDQRYLFDFTLTSDNGSDRTRVVFNPDADFAYEIGRDAAKFFSADSGVPHIYT